MANPYLASLIAVWRREKQKRAVAAQPQPTKQKTDIWGAPLRPKQSPTDSVSENETNKG